jgi:uncharacterized protein YheU (UPF0270 family)
VRGDESEEDGAGGCAFVEIALDQLSPAALRGLAEEFVTRDGTDYGSAERSLEEKVARLMGQLGSGEARIVFDPESETANVVLTRELSGPERS